MFADFVRGALLAGLLASALVTPASRGRSILAVPNEDTTRLTAPGESRSEPRPGQPVQTEMRNVNYHASPWVTLNILKLRGEMQSKKPGRPPIFEDKGSFLLKIRSAEIGMSAESLSGLLNKHVFAYPGSPIEKVEVSIEPDRIIQKGVLRKALKIPFSIVGTVSVTPEGELRVHPTSIRVAGVGVRGLMKIFGLRMGRLVKLEPDRGVRVAGNDMLLAPDRILPPPQIRGTVTRARLEPGRMVLIFDSPGEKPAPKLSPPDRSAPNFMYYEGGTLAFGRLTMKGTRLQIVDADPRDPFDFFLDHYNEQLVAGYDQNLPDGGLIVHMPDYGKLSKAGDARPRIASTAPKSRS